MKMATPAEPSAVRTKVPWSASISADLDAVEKVLRHTLSSPRRAVLDLVSHLENYKGKRLRPALLLLTARACGGITPQHHTLGAVVEMIHTATLVHDDVLDEATVRRHVPTINAAWNNQTSILLGDFLFTHAFHLASSVDVQACSIIGAATNAVCEGELLQCVERGDLNLGEEKYLEIIEGKTAELTSCCCRLGAVYAGTSAAAVEALADYGRYLGMAVQIADYLLDCVGDERTTGKSLGTDAKQSKLTLPLIHLLSKSNAAAQKAREILEYEGNHKREALLPLLAANGSLAYAETKACKFADQARAQLHFLAPSEAASMLEVLTDRVVHRTH